MHTSQLYARQLWLRSQRKKLGWSIEDVAAKLHVMSSEYQAYEEGRIETHSDIEFEELKYYFEQQIRHRMIEGDEKVHMDRFER